MFGDLMNLMVEITNHFAKDSSTRISSSCLS